MCIPAASCLHICNTRACTHDTFSFLFSPPFLFCLSLSLLSLSSLYHLSSTHTHTNKQVHLNDQSCRRLWSAGKCVCVRVHVCACVCGHICAYVCLCVCVWWWWLLYCTCACVYTYVYTCTCVRVRVCGYIFHAVSHSTFLTNASHETHESRRQATSDTMQIHTHVRVTWLIHMCAMTHSYVWLDLLICATRIIHMTSWLMDGLPAANKYCLTGNFRWTFTTYAASLLKSRGVSSCVLPCVAIWRGVF